MRVQMRVHIHESTYSWENIFIYVQYLLLEVLYLFLHLLPFSSIAPALNLLSGVQGSLQPCLSPLPTVQGSIYPAWIYVLPSAQGSVQPCLSLHSTVQRCLCLCVSLLSSGHDSIYSCLSLLFNVHGSPWPTRSEPTIQWIYTHA